jgi:HD-GYP domain-containing protein (c-di-GMP phosphodiesterase class II)
MDNTIFLLTLQKNLERVLFDSIPIKYKVNIVSKNNLMVELYKKSPILLIVDLDSITEQILEMIQSIVALSYLPVVYICSEEPSWGIDKLKDEIIVKTERIELELNNLIKQSVSFKRKYDQITESYEAIDLLSGEIKGLLDSYLNTEIGEEKNFVSKLFNLVLGKNRFLSNKPQLIWIIEPHESEYVGRLFSGNGGGEFFLKEIINVNESFNLTFDLNSENGFIKNFNIDEMSDIGSSKSIFPETIIRATGNIINFAGYSVNKLIIVGINYYKPVTSYDSSIIKAITIYYDLMKTIKFNINELEQSFDYTTNALARAAEVNDDSTGNHIKRVNIFSKLLAEEMGMDKKFIKNIYNSGQMHDVGKIYIDRNILAKPGKLLDNEFEDMKKHTIYGEKIIGDSDHLSMSAEIARNHHEKYDGTGYPDGKKGDEIPLSARIVALADVYDALRSPRTYKPAFSHEKCYEIITVGDGRVQPEHFDPKVLLAFKNIHKEISRTYDELNE